MKRLPVLILIVIYAVTAYGAVSVGTKLRAKQEISLRVSPPEQSLKVLVTNPGELIGKIRNGEIVTVNKVTTLNMLLKKDIWIKVTLDRGDEQNKPISGWAYYGTESESENFEIAQ